MNCSGILLQIAVYISLPYRQYVEYVQFIFVCNSHVYFIHNAVVTCEIKLFQHYFSFC